MRKINIFGIIIWWKNEEAMIKTPIFFGTEVKIADSIV